MNLEKEVFQKENQREDGRTNDRIRPIFVKYDYVGYASASILFCMGKTKVLVSVTLQDGLPPFLRGQKVGWLNAEYAMLPCATKKRSNRESNQQFKNPRSVEISRLIGRSFRSVIDLSLIPEKTIIIDCDVLQADGGTRVASITAANLALNLAQKRWIRSGIIEKNILKEQVGAISLGFVKNNLLLDLTFNEDSQAESDFNFVLTKSGKIIEIQGTAEKKVLSWEQFDNLKTLALSGINQLFETFEKLEKERKDKNFSNKILDNKFQKPAKLPMFSLANRLGK
ncbi:ribonuclease PH [Candidatus Babeliales bacterium]|nr:ribonuclease PH [Candidatus Babeliales bacterium]MCF7899465.1 ribonuclease PH [Candidatus Babeliales bacterium]